MSANSMEGKCDLLRSRHPVSHARLPDFRELSERTCEPPYSQHCLLISPDPDLRPAPRWGGVLGGRGVHHTSHLPPLAGKEFHDVMAVSRMSKQGRVQHLSP
ncbi:unnamed protein product [Arctogadus glacialis]